MGSKDSFSGGGGSVGNDLRDGLDEWLASLPGGGDSTAPADPSATASHQQTTPTAATSAPSPGAQRVAKAALLFKTSSGVGNAARRGADAQFTRSAATSSRIAGRGAAAAYAYRTGDREALQELGLDYDELRANPNTLDVVYAIAQAICSELPPGTIETDELLHVVADISEWIVEADPGGDAPNPAEIARESLAIVVAWAYLTTTASELNGKGVTGAQRDAFEHEIRAVCEELAAQANLDPKAPTASEFAAAVEAGLEFLQQTYGTTDG